MDHVILFDFPAEPSEYVMRIDMFRGLYLYTVVVIFHI